MSGSRGTLSILLLSLLTASVAWGQDDPFEPQPTEFKSERKRPSVFRRPEKDTPDAQLAYATRLHLAGDLKQAARQYLALVHEWHDSSEAVRAQLAYAEILMNRGRDERAFREFQYLVDHYAGLFPHDTVLGHQLAIAHRVRTKRRGKFLFYPGFTAPERALPLLQRIVKNAPKWEKAPEAQFYYGRIRESQRDYVEAVAAYEVLQSRYPRSDFAVRAAHRRAVCLWALAEQSPRDEQRCQTAIRALAAFVRAHPGDRNTAGAREKLAVLTERLAQAVYERAVFYDRRARRPDSALIAYKEYLRRFPLSSRAAEVHKRIKDLEAEQEPGDEK